MKKFILLLSVFVRLTAFAQNEIAIITKLNTVFFECEALDQEVARLQAAGITFDQLPTAQQWLWREARLRDPAGNAICLYQADENRRFPPWRLDA
jgi:uncharacterized glyoxalase superfamily protein PhnB